MPTDQPIIKAIATEYRGHRFRSRLEARWACFFDNCGWPWEYEALDLDGYIPDFILTLKPGKVLVEVKPVLSVENFSDEWPKIIRSGWKGEAIIVGAKIFNSHHGCAIGQMGEYDSAGGLNGEKDWAILQSCQRCECTSFFHATGSWRCRVCGQYKGKRDINPWPYDDARRLFADCGGVVQYNS